MAQSNIYKPRYSIAYTAKSKVWPYKNSYLRRFYALRARRVQRGGLFRRCVLVATTSKWSQARRLIRPFRQSAGSISTYSSGKTAFGRPFKRRYRYRFYRKQQLRFFHGKVKEEAFRRFFRTYLNVAGSRATSFFSAIESRLDRVFFRRRLLPTIYACHQFIHHYGLELNAKKEFSPRSIVEVGDMISVPGSVWKPFYWDLFCRVYYRRWGRYVRRRRLYMQLKKKLFLSKRVASSPMQRSLSFNLYKNFVKGKGVLAVSQKSIERYHSKSYFSRLNSISNPFIFSSNFKSIKGKKYASTEASNLYAVQRKDFLAESKNLPSVFLNLSKNYPRFRRTLGLLNFKGFSRRPVKISGFPFITQSKRYSKRRESSLGWFIQIIKQHITNAPLDSRELISKQAGITLAKLRHYHKLFFVLRLRKSLTPKVIRLVKQQANSIHKKAPFSAFYRRPHTRSRLLRLYSKRRKKVVRSHRTPRLKGVHFFIPRYLQRDFTTLRAVKIQSPSLEDIQYPFRASLAKRHSFYRAKGF